MKRGAVQVAAESGHQTDSIEAVTATNVHARVTKDAKSPDGWLFKAASKSTGYDSGLLAMQRLLQTRAQAVATASNSARP